MGVNCKEPKILVDLHGVVLDMQSALKGYFAVRGQQYHPENVISYDFDGDIGVEKSEIYKAFSDIALYDYIILYPDVEKAFALLRTRCTPQLYSTSVDDPLIMEKTLKDISSLGLSGNLVVGRKTVVPDADVLFEDCAAIHRQWADYGFTGLQYIIDRPYNKPKESDVLLNNTIRVKSLYEGVLDMFQRFGWDTNQGGSFNV